MSVRAWERACFIRPPFVRARFILLPFMLFLGACSAWPGRTVNTANPAATEAASSTPAPGVAACPSAQARYLTCGNGVKMMTYEAGLEMPRFCESLQQLEGRIRGFERNQPLYPLAGGERALLVGTAGWLLLPREADVTDVPRSMAAWWNNRACTLPTALRP